MSDSGFPGRNHKSGYPDQCQTCGEVATHVGAGVKGGHWQRYNYCIVCGPKAMRDRDVTSLKEISEFRTWKKKHQNEEAANPPSPQMMFLDDDT